MIAPSCAATSKATSPHPEDLAPPKTHVTMKPGHRVDASPRARDRAVIGGRAGEHWQPTTLAINALADLHAAPLAPLHPRDNTFPGEVFLHLAAPARQTGDFWKYALSRQSPTSAPPPAGRASRRARHARTWAQRHCHPAPERPVRDAAEAFI